MRRVLLVALCLSVFSSTLMAQTKFQSKYHCGKSDAQKTFEVGDVPGHLFGVAQGNCDATVGGAGEKSGVYTEVQEIWKSIFKTRGRFVVTMDNGDKLHHSYEAIGDPAKNTVAEKWKVIGGTGKYKSAQGSGTCTGKLNDDGSSDWDCTGTTTLGK
jgi:hypothetical protein